MLDRAARGASSSRHIYPPRVVIAGAVLIPQALLTGDLGGPVCTRRRMPRFGATHK
jgi:hypothetical protein